MGEWDTDLSLDLCASQIYALVTPRTDHLSYTNITFNEVSGEHSIALDNRAQSLSPIHSSTEKSYSIVYGGPFTERDSEAGGRREGYNFLTKKLLSSRLGERLT